MKYKFIRRSLIDSMDLFEKNIKNRNYDLSFKLKNKSSIILFFFLYVTDNLFSRLIINKLIARIRMRLGNYDLNIVFPPEGRVSNKELMHSCRRRYFRDRKRLRFVFYLKDYFNYKLNFISNYSSGFSDILLTNKLSYGFNLLNDSLSDRHGFYNNVVGKRISPNELGLFIDKYQIDDVTIRRFNKYISRKFLKSNSFVKLIALLQNKLNLKFISYFKMLYSMFTNKKFLFVGDYMNLAKDMRFNIDISYLELIKIILIKYVNLIFSEYSNNLNKKKIIIELINFYRLKLNVY